ncbi:hypothetical protein MKX50_19220 [Paenibacillus sp. FSL W8-0186]|uniref:Uncharacterized protein n=1 Tax=Paenibacillus woosongensis TaxID=307580 RepID=A0ABQ4MXR2_9BACL|nr:hypothetical protein [Paenibacillus woosongensis]GIP60729.1 hypothetical protein J15TS10_45430 [Paenibacillus woosongensis]
MRYIITPTGFADQTLEVVTSGIGGNAKLMVNNQLVTAKKRQPMILRRDDGQEVEAVWKKDLFGMDVPNIIIDGSLIQVAKPLPVAAKVWCFLPLVFIFIGGAIGALIGILAAAANMSVFRLPTNLVVKFIVTLLIDLVATGLLMFLASTLHLLLQ